MKSYEVFDGNRYRFSIMPNDGDPFKIIEAEQRARPGSRLIEIINGKRTEVVGPAYNTRYEEEESEYEEFDYEA